MFKCLQSLLSDLDLVISSVHLRRFSALVASTCEIASLGSSNGGRDIWRKWQIQERERKEKKKLCEVYFVEVEIKWVQSSHLVGDRFCEMTLSRKKQ